MAPQAYLDGVEWAQWGDGLRAYLEGDPDSGDRCELLPYAGGDSIPFVHDAEVVEVDGAVNALARRTLIVYVGEELPIRGVYTYAGERWTVDEIEIDRAGSASATFPYRTTLVKHAR